MGDKEQANKWFNSLDKKMKSIFTQRYFNQYNHHRYLSNDNIVFIWNKEKNNPKINVCKGCETEYNKGEVAILYEKSSPVYLLGFCSAVCYVKKYNVLI